MKNLFFAIMISLPIIGFAQNVGIGTTTPEAASILEIKKAGMSKVRISSNSYLDTAQLQFSNRTTGNSGTDINLQLRQEFGLFVSSSSDLLANNVDNILLIKPNGYIMMGTTSLKGRLTIADSVTSYTAFFANSKVLNTNVRSSLAFGGNDYTTGFIGTVGTGTSSARMGFSTGYSSSSGLNNLLERFSIANNGFIGINNTNPQAYLDLNGGMKISANNTIEFGSGVTKEANAGKIGYQTFSLGMLDIVGAGTTSSNRAIRVWNEGGAYFQGGINLAAGKVTQSSTGGAGLLPYAYGTISSAGAILNGTGNFTVTKFGTGSFGIYLANSESFSTNTHTATVSIANDGTAAFIQYYVGGGSPTPLVVRTVNYNAVNAVDRDFSFIIYKP